MTQQLLEGVGVVTISERRNQELRPLHMFDYRGSFCLISFLKLGFYNERSVFLWFYAVSYECFQWYFGVVELFSFVSPQAAFPS